MRGSYIIDKCDSYRISMPVTKTNVAGFDSAYDLYANAADLGELGYRFKLLLVFQNYYI